MSRRSGKRELPQLERVEKIELSEKNVGWRLAFFILFVVIAAGAFASCVHSFFSKESGWYQIETGSTEQTHCGNEFIFMYELGAEGNATEDNRALSILYTDACVMAHQLFHNKELFEGVHNICYINQHPNEVIEVDAALYEAFSVIEHYANRNIYLAPVYNQYDEIFYCEDDAQLVHFDPRLNEEVAADYAEIAAFANDADMVDVKLLGNNQVMLYVSEQYLAYAKENYITDFIDFFWMKNAFVVDYLAETMIEKGYTRGTISSYDGFSRVMDQSGNSFSYNIYDKSDSNVYQAAVMQYEGPMSLVFFRNYMMSDMDWQHYYVLSNGEVRNCYVDAADGISKAAVDNFYAYGRNMRCAEILMQAMPVYLTEQFDTEAAAKLTDAGVYSVYCKDNVIYYHDSEVLFTDILSGEKVVYTAKLINKKN